MINKRMELKYQEFCQEYDYEPVHEYNTFSIYDFTDFIQTRLADEDRIDYIRYFIDQVSGRENLRFRGNLHEISILTDPETDEFIGNLVHFYHGDNFCESFYGIIYFDEYPNFFEKTDQVEQNTELEIEGKLRLKPDMNEDFYYLEIHDVKYLEDENGSIIL